MIVAGSLDIYDVGCVPVYLLFILNVWIIMMVAGSLDIYDVGWMPGYL